VVWVDIIIALLIPVLLYNGKFTASKHPEHLKLALPPQTQN